MEVNKWDKLIKMVTHSYVPFLTYSVLFISLIVLLMSVIEIDSYKVYECTASEDWEHLIVEEAVPLTDADYMYIYVNKSDELIKRNIESVRRQEGATLIFPEEEIKSFLEKNSDKQYYVELPAKNNIIKSLFGGAQ